MYREWTQTDYQNKHNNINHKWLQHVQRVNISRLPKQALQYKPKEATTRTEDGHRLPIQALQYKPKEATIRTEDGHRLPKQALQYKPKEATTFTEDGHKQTTKTSTTI